MKAYIAAVFAVLSAFIGIRKRDAARKDEALKPHHFIIAAVLCVLLLIISIVMLVRYVVK